VRTMSSQESDQDLMLEYISGDMAAFEILYYRYESKVYNYLLRCLGNEDVARDLFQEVFLRLHRSRASYDPGFPFALWLFRIASNLVKNEYKRVHRWGALVRKPSDGLTALEERATETPEAEVISRELRDVVHRALQALPESQREVVVLSKYLGFSYPEIAEIVGWSPGGVKQRAHRAFERLRNLIPELF